MIQKVERRQDQKVERSQLPSLLTGARRAL
jgi:hypothetical protein